MHGITDGIAANDREVTAIIDRVRTGGRRQTMLNRSTSGGTRWWVAARSGTTVGRARFTVAALDEIDVWVGRRVRFARGEGRGLWCRASAVRARSVGRPSKRTTMLVARSSSALAA